MSFFNELKKNTKDHIKNWISHADIKGATTVNLQWILTQNKEIEKYILSKNTKDGTKSAHFVTLAKILERLGDQQGYKKYSKIATNYNKKVQAKQREQEVLPERTGDWVPWEEVMQRRKELRKESKEDPENYKKHLTYLILALYTYQPPIRGEYFNMEVVKNKPPENNKNYLWDNGDKYTIVLNNYKTKKKYGRREIDIESDELARIIEDSLERFPRKYLLSSLKKQMATKPLTYRNFFNYIKLFPDKNVSVDLLRSFYITQFYNNLTTDDKGKYKIHTIADKERLAAKMLHSVSEAEKSYNKPKENVDSDSEDDESESEDEEEKIPEKKKKEKKIKEALPQKPRFDRKAWSKKYMPEYLKKNAEIISQYHKNYYEQNKYDILRKKIIRELNGDNVDKPKPATILKYNLIFNEETGLWS